MLDINKRQVRTKTLKNSYQDFIEKPGRKITKYYNEKILYSPATIVADLAWGPSHT